MNGSNRSSSCWTKCLCCISTCKRNRVAPSDPIQVITPPGPQVPSDKLESRSIQNGNTSPRTTSENHLKDSVFIEAGKERRLRVLHLSPVQIPPEILQVADSLADESDAASNPGITTEGKAESEDEYWFSKWTRKPRFQSIFKKNTIHSSEYPGSDEDEPKEISEAAKAASNAKRRAWAYRNENEPRTEPAPQLDNEEEEFNSINMLEPSCSTQEDTSSIDKDGQQQERLEISPSSQRYVVPTRISPSNLDGGTAKNPLGDGFTNLGFQNDEDASEVDPDQVQIEIGSPDEDPHSDLRVSNTIPNGTDPPNAFEMSPSPSSRKAADGRNSLRGTPRRCEEDNNNVNAAANKLPLLFFIHGIASTCEVWQNQIDFFHQLGYEIIAPDLLGHGYSSTPNLAKYYLFESLAQDLLQVYDFFVKSNGSRKVVLIGHGYGACLASVMTRVRPKSVCMLISIAGGGPTPLVSRACCKNSFIPPFYCQLFHTRRMKGRFENPELDHVLPSNILDNILAGQIWSDGDSTFYRRVAVPTLLVYGMKDNVVTLVEECEMERTIPKSFLEIIDSSGHMVMVEEPAKVNRMLGKFIQSWS